MTENDKNATRTPPGGQGKGHPAGSRSFNEGLGDRLNADAAPPETKGRKLRVWLGVIIALAAAAVFLVANSSIGNGQ